MADWEEKQHKHKLFGSEIPVDIPDPHAQMPRAQKVSPHHLDPQEKIKLFGLGTGMTGPLGHPTMEINGRSTVSYLVRTPRAHHSLCIF